MRAGVVRFRSGRLFDQWSAQVVGANQKSSLHRPEAAALSHGVKDTPVANNLFLLVDNQSTLITLHGWIGA